MIETPEFCKVVIAQDGRRWEWAGVYVIVNNSLLNVFTRHHAPGDRPGRPSATDHVASFPLTSVLWMTERDYAGDPYVVGDGRDPVDGAS